LRQTRFLGVVAVNHFLEMIHYGMNLFCFVLSLSSMLGATLQQRFDRPVSIIATMIARDEAVNFESNLALWLPVIDYFVFMVDSRTRDETNSTIARILDGNCKGYHIKDYLFEGFGPARTASLIEAFKQFPQATHVWITDPDWRPNTKTMVNKDDINYANVDAFRFLIYDRNGDTTRRADWLLRNREGLRMRYHLHEVLDIGESYEWLNVDSWTVHEIEQKGSWHTTVGHESSMAANRYLFDLDLLLKDLELYGHDPHTHYYLGVTYHAYAEKRYHSQKLKSPATMNTVNEYLDKSIEFCKLRLTSSYKAEFIEERWGIAMLLGQIFMTIRFDFEEARHWLSQCRDYNPKQTECSYLLVMLYMSNGRLEEGAQVADALMKTKYENRVMLNHFKSWSCEVPKVVHDVLGKGILANLYGDMPSTLSKYLLLLGAMVRGETCVAYDVTLTQDQIGMEERVSSVYPLQGDSTVESLCAEEDVQQYIKDNDITLHPCQKLRNQMAVEDACREFIKPHPTLDEASMAKATAEHIGVGSILDLINNIYGGDATRITDRTKFRVLLVNPHNPRGALALLAFAHHYLLYNIEVVVITPKDTFAKEINNRLDICGKGVARTVQVISSEINTFFSRGDLDQIEDFQYIQYNGGFQLSKFYRSHLRKIMYLLDDEGTLGLTVFADNVFTREMTEILNARNVSFQKPFSEDPSRSVLDYLHARGLSSFSNDIELVYNLLAGGATLTGQAVEEDLGDAGWIVESWLVDAHSKPYHALGAHPEIAKYKVMGWPESVVVENILGNFRHSVYASKADIAMPGKAVANDDLLMDITRVYIVDRTLGNSLSTKFQDAILLGRSARSIMYSVSHRGLKENITHICMPSMLPGLQIIGATPSIAEMLKVSESVLGETLKGLSYLGDSLAQTLKFLHFLDKHGHITFYKVGATNSPSRKFIESMRKASGIDMALNKIMSGGVGKIPDMSSAGTGGREKTYMRRSEQKPIAGMRKISDNSRPKQAAEVESKHQGDSVQEFGGLTFSRPSTPKDSIRQTVATRTKNPPKEAPTTPKGTDVNFEGMSMRDIMAAKKKGLGMLEEKMRKMGFTQSMMDEAMSLDGTESDSAALKPRKVSNDATKKDTRGQLSSLLDELGGIQKASKDPGMERSQSKSEIGPFITAKGPVNIDISASEVHVEQVVSSRLHLLSHFRSVGCVGSTKPHCHEAVNNRVTDSLEVTSLAKVRFDVAQLRYIAFTNSVQSQSIIHQLLPKVQETMKRIIKSGDTEGVTVLDVAQAKSAVNRAFHIAPDSSKAISIHDGAKVQLKAACDSLAEQDFAVVDVILKSQSIKLLTSIFLTSTFWFDVTNGAAFVSHPDDGLVHWQFKSLAQNLAAIVSSRKKQYSVRRYHAVAMDLSETNLGPLAINSEDEISFILWINHNTPAVEENEMDGIRIYEPSASSCVKRLGASLSDSRHPYFVSTASGSLDVSVESACDVQTGFVPRENNRLVFVGPGMLYSFVTPGLSGPQKPFNVRTSTAFVLVLGV
jgi:hypothetical protein